MKNKCKRYLSMLLVFLLLFSSINIPVNAVEMNVANHVIISQVYGGGGNSGAQYQYDFIELYNPTNQTVDLTGCSVQYTSSTGTTYSNITPLTGSIGSGEYYLIQEAAGSGSGTTTFPTPNAIGTINMSGTKGKVALVSNSEAISGKSDENVIDFVGFGAANEYEGTAPTGILSNSTAAVRKGVGVDSNDNAADFEVTAPNPRSGSTETDSFTIGEAKAAEIGNENIKAEGVITYVNNKNVYIQDETGAICLYLTSNATNLTVGDAVYAVGKRENYNNLIELTGIDEENILIKSNGNEIPDRGTATVAELIYQPEGKTAGYDHMCEIIQVNEAVLTDTGKLSQNGSEIKIYPAVNLSNYPGIVTGDTVNVKLRMYDYKGTLQVEINDMTKAGQQEQLVLSFSPQASDVTSGTTVTINCNDENAAIYYTLDGSNPTLGSSVYSGSITISGNIGDTVTMKAIAKADGKIDSEVITAQYTIKDPNASLTIKEVLALPKDKETKDVVVTGQIVYFASTYSNPVIQADIDGETYSLYVYGAVADGAKVGDLVRLTGTYKVYNGLPELMSIIKSEIIGSEAPMEAQTVTIAELKSNGQNMLGRFVKIENVILGTYNGSGNTPITFGTDSINIYKGTPYPTLVESGDVVDVYAMVACYNTTVQLYTGTQAANGFNIYDVANDTKKPVITLPQSYLDAKTNQDYTISVDVEDNKAIQGVTLSYSIGDNTIYNQVMSINELTGKYEYTIPGNQILSSVESIEFTVKATDITELEAVTDTQIITINNAPQVIAFSPERNSSTGEDKSPVISVTLKNAGINPTVTLTLKKDNNTIIANQIMTKELSEQSVVYSYATQTLQDGIYNATVTIVREDSQSTTATWNFTVGQAQYKAYFGQLHAHTAQYSDGSGTLADGLNYLTNIPTSDNVDFISFTDHSNYFDTTAAPNPVEAMNDKSKMTASSLALWNTYISDIKTFNDNHAGSLLALAGFEMTWSGGPGHINTFNSDGLVSRNNTTLNNKTADAGMKAYYDALIQNPEPLANLSQFNHPGKTFGTFSDFAYWSPAYDNKMVAVEVGNGEGAIDSGGYFPSYSEYTKALDKGWHVAPTNNQDNHKGHWGNSNTARTVIITDNLSTDGLLTGLKNMSVYSTEDKNLNISYTVNDLIMGNIISEVPQNALQFDISIDDEDNNDIISKVEIITNGGRIAESKTFDSNAVDWSFELPSAQGYYYVRVTQADKNIAVTAPIWVGQAPLVGISALETDTKMPVTGESLTLKTTLFNNEEQPVTLNTVQYAQGDTILATENVNTEIVSTGTLNHTFDYIPTTADNTKITVTAVVTIKGQQKTFTMDLDLNVRDSERLVYVGIDASHYNEYVNGNYKDSMGNFANMAVGHDVRVVELTSSEALIEATKNPKYKMLVLTPPTRRNGNAFLLGYKSYSQEEITAIKEFAEAGKTVIITGWGDYYESYTKYSDGTSYTLPASEQMSAQQNRLLAAIGSNLRISDDEIKDDGNNGGQAQRLYLKNYNLNNSFLGGVKPSEQVYSNYGGSTIYVAGADGQPSNTLDSTVSPMVYTFDTSYSSDDDKDGTTGIEGVTVPKYNDKYMVAASQTITYEDGKIATVIVAGSAFMSNFEIQVTMDSYSTPAYSNYTILENIVKSINPVTVSSIAEVQAADEGKSFTIRGIVTSNASGYDKDTAFFDCIYAQDATAGINAFPVSGNIQAGQTVEITGKTSSYNGERQIAVEKITVIDETIKLLPTPIIMTTAEAANGNHLGSLVTVSGIVESIEYSNDVVESIFIKDNSNTKCRVFIDGYITSDKTISNLAVGAKLTATGLSSIDTEGARIRICDRADIICTAEEQVQNWKFAVISDPHYFAPELLINRGTAFETYLAQDRKLIAESHAIVSAAVQEIKQSDVDIVLVSGDLTKDGAKASHEGIANILAELEAVGKKVYVIDGNHDINNPHAYSYDGENQTKVPHVTPAEFKTIYGNFGYKAGDEIYRSEDPNSLSYVVEPVNGLWIIAMDSAQYDSNIDDAYPKTAGQFKPETLKWIEDAIKAGKAQGKTVIGFMHHGAVEHFSMQNEMFDEYVIDGENETKDPNTGFPTDDGWKAIADKLADAGMNIVFTGHFHAQDIVKHISANGNNLYDIETGSLVTYPVPYRVVEISDNKVDITTKRIESINYNTGAMTFQDYAKNYLESGLDTLVEYMLTNQYGVTGEQLTQLKPMVISALSAHYQGDERITAQMSDIITSMLQIQEPTTQMISTALNSIWNDPTPEDNAVIIDLESGQVNVPTNITLDKEKYVVTIGETGKLIVTAQIADGTTKDVTDKATYISSNPEIATVENGVIKAKKEGEVEITVIYGSQTDTVTVKAKVDECFIATAAFGSKFQPSVKLLRGFRDNFLLTNPIGSAFVKLYYKTSPPIANFIAKHDALRLVVRILLIPFIAVANVLMNPTSISSIATILLVIGLLILSLRRRKSICNL